MAPRKSISDALGRLAAAEDRFLRQEFLAPVLRGGGVQVRIAGVRCQLRVEPADFEGWGVFRPLSHTVAQMAREARMAERRQYLAMFPAASLVLCRREGWQWLAVPAGGDVRFRIDGAVPVRLVADDMADLFDTVRARFDGAQFWFEETDARADPGAAAYLRQALMADPDQDPARLDRPGLTPGQRAAFAENGRRRRELEQARRAAEAASRRREAERLAAEARRTGQGRVREALMHAGAELRDFAERGGVYRVTYEVDGRRHTSLVTPGDLTVQTAGICLSGEDRKFDLHSLVGVLREAGER